MTTDLLELTDKVTRDTEDTLLEQAIREKLDEIRQALKAGRDYVLQTDHGSLTIRAKKA